MSISLLPGDFDQRLTQAVAHFWQTRGRRTHAPSGREAVVAGKNMDGFVDVVRAVAAHCGVPDSAVCVRSSEMILPGYFRATKNWDVLVVDEGRLLGVFEFKSQVGSFGNNFNNRAEEVIGSATDLWVAHHHGAYGGPRRDGPMVRDEPPAALNPVLQSDPRPPFLAWLMLLEECPASMRAVRCDEPHFPVFDAFRDASYAGRYQLLCERLMERRLYSAACLLLTPTGQSAFRSLSGATSARSLFSEFAGRLLASRER